MKKILLAAILALWTTTLAFAAPTKMTDNQLDEVTAGATTTVEVLVKVANLPANTTLTIKELIELVSTQPSTSSKIPPNSLKTSANEFGEIEEENSTANRNLPHRLEHTESVKQSGIQCRR